MEKKSLILNCEVCDARKLKEEDYRQYDKITINAEVLIVNEMSKSILLRLPVRQNIERILECAEETDIKVANGAYEISADMMPQKPVILVANGPLKVMPGTEEIMKKYKCMIINGSAEFPDSLKEFAGGMVVNGRVSTYPDDHVILEDDFVMNLYFPARAREGTKYFARNAVIIQDMDVDITKLLQKNIRIKTPRLIVPESRIEECARLFDAEVDFVVVPDRMTLVYGDAVLDEELIFQKGRRLFVYGSLKLEENVDMEMLQREIEQLVVTGSVSLYKEQREKFQKLNARYKELHVENRERVLQGMVTVRLTKKLFESSPDGIRIGSAVKVVIEEDVTPDMLINGLNGINCLQIECSEEQRDALYSIKTEYGMIPPIPETPSGQIPAYAGEVPSVFGQMDAAQDKTGPAVPEIDAPYVINAESYVM